MLAVEAVIDFGYLKTIVIKKKAKIAARKIHGHLSREPFYTHPRLSFIPNIILNILTFLVALALVGLIVYVLVRVLVKAFYHL